MVLFLTIYLRYFRFISLVVTIFGSETKHFVFNHTLMNGLKRFDQPTEKNGQKTKVSSLKGYSKYGLF